MTTKAVGLMRAAARYLCQNRRPEIETGCVPGMGILATNGGLRTLQGDTLHVVSS